MTTYDFGGKVMCKACKVAMFSTALGNGITRVSCPSCGKVAKYGPKALQEKSEKKKDD